MSFLTDGSQARKTGSEYEMIAAFKEIEAKKSFCSKLIKADDTHKKTCIRREYA